MKVKRISSTQRSLAWLKSHGYTCGIVEKWNRFGGAINPTTGERIGSRQDLFGFIDIIAIGPEGVVGVQCTSGSNHSSHIQKIFDEYRFYIWVRHCKVLMMSWTKKGKKDSIKKWEARLDWLDKNCFTQEQEMNAIKIRDKFTKAKLDKKEKKVWEIIKQTNDVDPF